WWLLSEHRRADIVMLSSPRKRGSTKTKVVIFAVYSQRSDGHQASTHRLMVDSRLRGNDKNSLIHPLLKAYFLAADFDSFKVRIGLKADPVGDGIRLFQMHGVLRENLLFLRVVAEAL